MEGTNKDVVSMMDYKFIEELEKNWNDIGEDKQVATIENLQCIIEKQQQIIGMMANCSKMMYDTAMAIIHMHK